ncbi:MAG: cell division protein FtsA [Candidatus Levybacteria bacterium]|nr:cell division protein FtsA [Candidatus Levybacteria bacterium]
MSEGKVVVGIDIGTSKVATIIAKIDESVNILGVSEVAAAGIRKGQIVNIEEAVSVINTSLESSERMAGYSASHVIASIGGSHIESLNSKGVVAVSAQEGEITKSDMLRVVEAAKAISLTSSREIIHVLPRNYTVDGQEGIKDPIGMTGVRLEVDTHIVTANATSVRNLEKALSEVGVDVDAVVFNGYASALAVLSDTEKELGVVLVDIGAGTTDIAIYVEGALSYSSVLPIGSRHITNDLAIGLRISLESAEKIKLFLSQPMESRRMISAEEETPRREGKIDVPNKSDELDLSTLALPEEIRRVSKKTLIEGIIRPRLNEIFTMIGLQIKNSGYGGQTPAGLVITGGGAKTVGAQEAAKRTLAMPVRIAAPLGLKGIIDEVQSPAFASAIGLILYGARLESSSLPFGFNFPQLPFGKFGKILKRIIDFIKSFMP